MHPSIRLSTSAKRRKKTWFNFNHVLWHLSRVPSAAVILLLFLFGKHILYLTQVFFGAVSCVPPGLGRLCAEPHARAQHIAPRICRIPFVFAAPTHGPCRSFLPEPRTAPFDGRRRPSASIATRAILSLPADPHELRMGLRMGTMQAPRWQRRADARKSFWHVQARHHGGRLGGAVHGELLPCSAFISYSLLPRLSATHAGANLASMVFSMVVYRLYGIPGNAVRCASADAEQQRGRVAPADVAPA